MSPPIRVMLVDDSAAIRGLLRKTLTQAGDIEVVATAADGKQAIDKVDDSKVDVMVLDIIMPEMTGFEALPLIRRKAPKTRVIMLSGLTEGTADLTLKALALGAVDFIPKPKAGRDRFREMSAELIEKIRVHAGRTTTPGAPGVDQPGSPARGAATLPRAVTDRGATVAPPPMRPRKGPRRAPEVIAIGSSTGGPNALVELFHGIDPRVSQPMLLTQHMPPVFTASLARRINDLGPWSCAEAQDGERIEEGHIYVAPGDYHMTVERNGDEVRIRLTQTEKVNFCRPAVDVMLHSMATAYGGRILVVILTGMGEDGRRGCAELAPLGCTIIAQDKETSVVWGMPGSVTEAGLADAVLPLDQIGARVGSVCMSKVVT